MHITMRSLRWSRLGLRCDTRNPEESEKFFVDKRDDHFIIFGGSSHGQLTAEICARLNVPPGRISLGKFADGETKVRIFDEPRGADCYLIQSMPDGGKSSDFVMETMLAVAALRRASAKSVTVVLPYVPYARRKGPSVLPGLLAASGVDRVVCVELDGGAEGWFDAPVANIDAQGVAVRYFINRPDLRGDIAVVSPDGKSTMKAKKFWQRLQAHGLTSSLATLLTDGPFEFLVGSVRGKDCILIDECVDSGEKILKASQALKSRGARRIFVLATHATLTAESRENIRLSPIVELVTTNTVATPHGFENEKVRVLSVGALLAEAVRRVQAKESVTGLFECATVDALLDPRS